LKNTQERGGGTRTSSPGICGGKRQRFRGEKKKWVVTKGGGTQSSTHVLGWLVDVNEKNFQGKKKNVGSEKREGGKEFLLLGKLRSR